MRIYTEATYICFFSLQDTFFYKSDLAFFYKVMSVRSWGQISNNQRHFSKEGLVRRAFAYLLSKHQFTKVRTSICETVTTKPSMARDKPIKLVVTVWPEFKGYSHFNFTFSL